MKGVTVVTDLISLGFALKMVQGVNLLSKTGLQVGAKAVVLDLTCELVQHDSRFNKYFKIISEKFDFSDEISEEEKEIARKIAELQSVSEGLH